MVISMIDELLNKLSEYNTEADLEIVKKAYHFADDAHEGQVRNSGAKYITHPLNVALILADLNMDIATICSGLLHDVIEDTPYDYEDVEELFGTEIADIVSGVTKLKNLHYKTKVENQAENIRRMILAMSKDIRVIIVKLADRLHNMRTLEYKTPVRQREIAQETLEIYAALAHRLGIWKIKWELEDLSLRYLDPDSYYELVEKVNKRRSERENEISRIISILRQKLDEVNVKCEIQGRPKSFYSIYKKMSKQNKSFEEIFDLTALRVIVDNFTECYQVLGLVHNLWKPLPGRFKDYIAMPKTNIYQSIHTTVIGDNGEVFEVQIRTWEMHRIAEYGVAAHWRYKEGKTKETDFDQKIQWVRQLLEWQSDINDPTDFVAALKGEIFSSEVFVFTPNGDVLDLPEDATPIDFAYRIHTQVGHKCVGATVNGKIAPLNHKLQTGDIVRVITSNATPGPSRDWLKIVKSNQAKSKIRQWFKEKEKDLNLLKGRDMIEKEIKRLGYDLNKFMDEECLAQYAASISLNTVDALFASVGYGSTTVNQILSKLKQNYNEKYEEKKEKLNFVSEDKYSSKREDNGVVVKGADNLKVRFAKCCNPVPGDNIVGFITKGRGIAVHRVDCTNITHNEEQERLIPVEWNSSDEISYSAEIQVRTMDRIGLLAEATTVIANAQIEMISLNTKRAKDNTVLISIVLQIPNTNKLSALMKKLRQVDGILDVYRLHS